MRTTRGAVGLVIAAITLTAGAPAASAKNPPPGSAKANRMVAKQIEDRRFVGVRGDGAGVDWVFCADRTYETRTTSDGSTGVGEGRGWKVVDAVVKRGGTWWEAVVEDRLKGGGTSSVAIGRHGRQFLTSVAFGIFSWGEVDRTPAGDAC